jgi:leucyl aminopeptidase
MTKSNVSQDAIPLIVVPMDQVKDTLDTLPASAKEMAEIHGFKGALGQAVYAPDGAGKYIALVGFGDAETRRRGRFHLANGAQKLPSGIYSLTSAIPCENPQYEVLGWHLENYKFDRYVKPSTADRVLVTPDWLDQHWLDTMISAETLCRDLVNTPSNDMGPAELEQAARDLAKRYNADLNVIIGQDLIDQNFPMVHAVGRASSRGPRLIDLRWGAIGPKVTLVGKGVCFDTGGLDLKPASGMGLMKKDMGGAANTMALASMIMGLNLQVQLRLLIPAVENAVSGNAFRPQDILISRKGLSVEINNTDAEGRLVLADALAYACEDDPDLVISMATLTGAARVAVGSDLVAFFSDHQTMTEALKKASVSTQDPVWELPFWDPYERMIEPGIADLDNAPGGGHAGAITAALFLRRFVSDPLRYMHFDINAWTPASLPGRPKGGATQGPRALFSAISEWVNSRG